MVSVSKTDSITRKITSDSSSVEDSLIETETTSFQNGGVSDSKMQSSMSLKEAWGSYMNKILSSSTKEAPEHYPVSPKHRRNPGPDEVQPAQGDKIDRTEMGSFREIDSNMHLEPQGLEDSKGQSSQSADSSSSTTRPPTQKIDDGCATAPNTAKAAERHMALEQKPIVPQRKPEFQGSGPEWQAERNHLLRQVETLQQADSKQEYIIRQLKDHNTSLQSQLTSYQHGYDELMRAKDVQSRQYDEWLAQLKARVQTTEQGKCELQEQVAKMSEIISQLNKKGLPLSPDDNYLSHAFNTLIGDTRQWARIFTKGQPPLTCETLEAVHFSDEMICHLHESFFDLKGLLDSSNVGSKVRTRCVEALLLRTFTGSYLTDRYIGFDHALYDKCQDILDSLDGSSAQEAQFWSALTNHLMTKDDDKFIARQNREIDKITNDLYDQLLSLGGSTSKRATKQSLRELVSRVAKLGHLIAQLPFRIEGRDIKLGTKKYSQALMENIDGEMEGSSVDSMEVTIVLCKAWIKGTFDDKGDPNHKTTENYVYTKARVSCLT
ncbi:hypothetical protein BGX38DRAFT_1152926 [Terfezia claveryi]|nr:hypothetical protein BGX38DRAFT_1152926 [Terfezia claveryi]